MARKLDYRWHLRHVMAARGMFATTDLIEPLAQRGIHLSSSQVYWSIPGFMHTSFCVNQGGSPGLVVQRSLPWTGARFAP